MNKATIISGLMATAMLALPAASFAVVIDGEIGIGGFMQPTCAGGAPNPACTMDIADGVTFVNYFVPNGFAVTFATGDFATFVTDFNPVTNGGVINDFDFAPLNPNPVNPLWTIAGFSFSLESISIVDQNLHFLSLAGTGTLTGNGFDPTGGSWTLSGDDAGAGLNFSWSSTTIAPEPGILVLLGMGLIGVIGSRKLIRS